MTDFFNVEKDYLLEETGPGYDAYSIRVDNLRFYGRNASYFDMTVCSRYIYHNSKLLYG